MSLEVRNTSESRPEEDLPLIGRKEYVAFPEWGLRGIDDPSFVSRMASFVRSHGRVELLSFFNGKTGSVYDLASKPRSRAAYRRLIVPLERSG